MGAGQIGGIATLLDIDFNNAPEFLGTKSMVTDAQFMIHYMSHALLFCVGALIEAHVALTPAVCVFGERYKFDVIAGTHRFLEKAGIVRTVQHLCVHRSYNHSSRWKPQCTDNVALIILDKQFSFNRKEFGADYVINRVRYGVNVLKNEIINSEKKCSYYGWGSRRNGFLIPLLLHLHRVDVTILSRDRCTKYFHTDDRYLCIQQGICKNEDYGHLCPDDVGSVIVCKGFVQAMMTSRLLDRPCGTGFLDMTRYHKFLRCGVDDSRDVIEHTDDTYHDFTSPSILPPSTVPISNETSKEDV